MLRSILVVCACLLCCSAGPAETPHRPRIYGLASVRVKSSDFEKSSETYRKLLGFGSGTNTGTNGCTQVTRPCFVVNVTQHIELTQAHPGDPGSWLDEIAFSTSSARVMRDYLRANGFSVSEMETAPNGTPFIELQDPEGNRIAFVETPVGNAESHVGPTQVSARLFHAGFVVKNLAPMKHFYMDVLGFRLYWKGGFKDLPRELRKKIPTLIGLKFRFRKVQIGSNSC